MPQAIPVRVIGPGKQVRLYRTQVEAAKAIGQTNLSSLLRQSGGEPVKVGKYTVSSVDVPPATAKLFRGIVFHGGLVVLEPKPSAREIIQKSVAFNSIHEIPEDLSLLTDFVDSIFI